MGSAGTAGPSTYALSGVLEKSRPTCDGMENFTCTRPNDDSLNSELTKRRLSSCRPISTRVVDVTDSGRFESPGFRRLMSTGFFSKIHAGWCHEVATLFMGLSRVCSIVVSISVGYFSIRSVVISCRTGFLIATNGFYTWKKKSALKVAPSPVLKHVNANGAIRHLHPIQFGILMESETLYLLPIASPFHSSNCFAPVFYQCH